MKLYDKNRREIMVGDTLKVFHFIGSHRKKHYMYKYVMSDWILGNNSTPFFKIDHLGATISSGGYYWECKDNRVLEHVEIVQGYGTTTPGIAFDLRPKLKV